MKPILLILLISSWLNAVNLMIPKESYTVNESITMDVSLMSGDKKDWIGIYPVGSSNAWENVVSWKWTGGKGVNWETITLPKVSTVGDYEARAFFKNSFKQEGRSRTFKVTLSDGGATELSTERYHTKDCHERIFVSFKNMGNNPNDWMALYPIDSNNEWENVKAWRWIESMENGRVALNYPRNIASGDYEIRAFFNNSFSVEGKLNPIFITPCFGKIKLSTSQEKYSLNKPVKVNFKDSSNENKNWIGIYKAGTKTLLENNLAWQWTNDKKEGQLIFENLPAGKYDVRAFFDNSYNLEELISFEIIDEEQTSFPKDLLGKGSNPANGIYVFYNESQDKAFISVHENSLYFDEHQGITAVNYSDKNNPIITAYQPAQTARANSLYFNEDSTLVTFLNQPYSLTNVVVLNAETLEFIDRAVIEYPTISYHKVDGLNLFYTVRQWAEQPEYTFYYISTEGSIKNVAMGSRGSDYDYLISHGTIAADKYHITSRKRNWDRDGKWESHKVIYDISNLPQVSVLETIIFDIQP